MISTRRAKACEKNAAKIARSLETAARPPGSRAVATGIKQGTHSPAHPHPPWTHDADPFYILSGGGAEHGRRPGEHAGERAPRTGLRRRSSSELRRVRHAGKTGNLRHQRSR